MLSSLHLILVVIVAVILIRVGHRRRLMSLRRDLFLLLILFLLYLNLLFILEVIVDAFKSHKNFGGREGWINVTCSLRIGTPINKVTEVISKLER